MLATFPLCSVQTDIGASGERVMISIEWNGMENEHLFHDYKTSSSLRWCWLMLVHEKCTRMDERIELDEFHVDQGNENWRLVVCWSGVVRVLTGGERKGTRVPDMYYEPLPIMSEWMSEWVSEWMRKGKSQESWINHGESKSKHKWGSGKRSYHVHCGGDGKWKILAENAKWKLYTLLTASLWFLNG